MEAVRAPRGAIPWRRLDLPRAVLGEGPVWDGRHGALVWVDLHGRRLRRYHPGDGREEVVATPSMAGAIAPRSAGGYVVALEDGFWTLDDGFSDLSRRLPLPDLGRRVWMNDARCDPLGRLWAGVVAADIARGAGALFRLDADWRLTRVIDGVTLSNGLGWSPDGRRMYHADSRRWRVTAYDFDMASGTPSNPRALIAIPEAEGSPDGLSVDAEGCIWLAVWDASVLRRYGPGGETLAEIRLPPRRVSSCCFGGADGRDLYITTAQAEIPAEEAAATEAGALFLARSPVAGMPIAPFAG
jgi:sugar lactone lactonase YvrE